MLWEYLGITKDNLMGTIEVEGEVTQGVLQKLREFSGDTTVELPTSGSRLMVS